MDAFICNFCDEQKSIFEKQPRYRRCKKCHSDINSVVRVYRNNGKYKTPIDYIKGEIKDHVNRGFTIEDIKENYKNFRKKLNEFKLKLSMN